MNKQHWWTDYPWRMVQTNFREIDMAGIDAEKFAADLEDFGATVVTLNAGGILASYESKLPYHTVSKYLTGDSLQDILAACHKRGIRVIARMDFSKIPVAVYEQHPDWAFRRADGEVLELNGFVQTCQNSVYQQEKAIEILQELLSTHPFDGVYCNMSGFVATDYLGKIHGFCTCDRCKAGFKMAMGMDAPTSMDMRNPAVMKYMGFQMGAGQKLRMKMNAAIKAINPEILVDKVDYLRCESHTSLEEPIWVYSASSNSRMTVGPERALICDNASVDFIGFNYRETSVSPGVMELRQWQSLANAGSTSVYIMGRLDNHMDKSSYEGTKKVFRFHKEHEDVFVGMKSAAEVLLVAKNRQGRDDAESYGWVRALSASHIPFDECKAGGVNEQILKDRKVVILADANDIKPEQCALLDAFAEKGGTVIATAASGPRGNAQALGCLGIEKLVEMKKDAFSTAFIASEPELIRCSAAPVIAPGPVIAKAMYAASAKKYLHTHPEPLTGPPEVCYATAETDDPGLVVNPYGCGCGIYIPWNCGSFYHAEGYTNTLNFMQDVLFEICGLPQIAPKLHPTVELVKSRKENQTIISLINASGYFGNSFFEPIPMTGIELAVPGITKAECLNGGKVTIEDGLVKLDRLDAFEMIIMEE